MTQAVAKLAADPHLTSLDQVPQEMKDALRDNPVQQPFLLNRIDYNLKNPAHIVSADKASYGNGFYETAKKVYLPPSDPNAITTTEQLMKAENDGLLTKAGFDRLSTEMKSAGTPDGAAVAKSKSDLFSRARGAIVGAAYDPVGEKKYDNWMALALSDYDMGIANGKTPAQLLTPDSPTYIGKTVDIFRRSMETQNKDIANAAMQKSMTDAVKTTFSGAKNMQEIVNIARHSIASGMDEQNAREMGKEQAVKLGLWKYQDDTPPAPMSK